MGRRFICQLFPKFKVLFGVPEIEFAADFTLIQIFHQSFGSPEEFI